MLENVLLVDGYNVLSTWPELAKLKQEDLAHARDRLIAMLGEFQSLCGIKVVLVFDAHQVRGGSERREVHEGVEVVYTREGEAADQWIERFVARQKGLWHKEGAYLFVATSDWLEQRIILAQGAFRITPLELYQEFQRVKKESQEYFHRFPDQIYLDQHLSDKIKGIFENWRRRRFEER